MKTIIATIKPFKVEEVKDALKELGCSGFRHTECKGYGKQKGHTELYRGAHYVVDFLPKVDIFITANDDQVDNVVQAILKAAKTGRGGDGRITVLHTEQFWNIRTGENEAAHEPAVKALQRRKAISDK